MNKRMLRFVALFLAAASVIGMAACGDAASGGDTASADIAAAENGDPERSISDDLPAKNFGGYNFRIMHTTYGAGSKVDPFAPSEATGDVVDDAIYERNLRVEERFNIKITSIDRPASKWSDYTQSVLSSILAGDDACDILMGHVIGGANNAIEGAYVNLYELEYLDFSKPWWSAQMVDEMTVKGQIYTLGDVLALDMLKSAKVHYINKDKFAEYQLELPYEQVFAGTWTLDKLISVTKDVYEDVNGNQERDDEDFFGYVSSCKHNGFWTSCDTPVLGKDENDNLSITVNSEKTINLIEKLGTWYYNTVGAFVFYDGDPDTGSSATSYQATLFASGHALVGFARVTDAASKMRNSSVEYGIIPFPKYDEKQADYYTFSGGDLLCVPVTNPDLERTSIILEAMTAETWKTVVPAYFSIALKEKFTYDSESAKCLDIINDSLTMSFGYCYDNWKGFGNMASNLFDTGGMKTEAASHFAANMSKAEARLKLITDFFEANEK